MNPVLSIETSGSVPDKETDQKNVAVLLAAYNGVDFIAEQIESILIQSTLKLHIFISIDKSDDGTEDFLTQLARSEPRLTLLPLVGRIGGAARNFFRLLRDVNFQKFDYIAFADQDDIWLPNKLVRAHQVLSLTGAEAYSSDVIAFWPDGHQTLIQKSQPQTQWDFLFEAAGPGCTYVMRNGLACAVQNLVRQRWEKVNEVGLHDWFVYAFARSNGYKWVIDDVPGMMYRQHNNNQVGVNAGLRAFIHRADKILSGWGLAQSALIAQLVGLQNEPFVLRWAGGSGSGLLFLTLHAAQCRRRLRDKFLFGLSCIIHSMWGRDSQ